MASPSRSLQFSEHGGSNEVICQVPRGAMTFGYHTWVSEVHMYPVLHPAHLFAEHWPAHLVGRHRRDNYDS